jgi:hypothetical protein
MLGSALRRKNDAEQYPFVRAYLPGSADMSAIIRRDNIVNLVIATLVANSGAIRASLNGTIRHPSDG